MRLLLLLFLSSCAFKESPSPPSAPGPSPIMLSWETDRPYEVSRQLVLTEGGFEAPTPITLSFPVPEKIYLAGAPALGDGIYLDGAFSTISQKEYVLAATQVDGRLEIVGLRSLLPEDKDQSLTLILVARNGKSGAIAWRLTVHLQTLPTPLPVEIVEIGSLPELRSLRSPALRLDLLKAVRIKNTKDRAITLSTAGRWPKGSIRRTFITYHLYPKNCSTDVGTTTSYEEYETKLALIPLYAGVVKEWLARSFEAGSAFEISPGSELLLGLFGSGPVLASFIDSGIPAVPAPLRNSPTSCTRESCGDHPRERFQLACSILVPDYSPMKEGREGGVTELVVEDFLGKLNYASSFGDSDSATREIPIFPRVSPLF